MSDRKHVQAGDIPLKTLMRKAVRSDSVTVCYYEDELYIVLSNKGNPLAKIPVDVAEGAVNLFIQDFEDSMQQRRSH